MNKTININLGGSLFYIEEDAYEILSHYLSDVESKFSSYDGHKEIIEDIESRIAEQLNNKLKRKNQAVVKPDIESIIKIMGDANAMESLEETEDEVKLVNHPAETSHSKKLYRNPDDKIIAGVCSGLGAYFGIDSVFIRIIFVLLSFLNGFGILAYIILWLVMPEAKTNVQKLEMHGKPINLKKIEQAVKNKSQEMKQEGKAALKKLKSNKSWLNKIVEFPVKVAEAIFAFLKKIMMAIGPFFRIFFGIIFLIAALFTALGLTIAAGVALFNVNSPYIVSDLPLQELTDNFSYFLFIAGIYLITLVPFIFLLLLGLSLARNKNSFRMISSLALIIIWFLAIAGTVVAALDLAPEINSQIATLNNKEQITKTYDYQDFNKLYLGANVKAKVIPGDEFSITMTGRENDLDLLDFNIEEGQLQIYQQQRAEPGKLCLFCFTKNIETAITMPRLDSFVAIRHADAKISGFKDDIYVSLGEAAYTEINLEGQNLDCSLSGVSSELKLTGKAENITCKLDGNAKLITDGLAADSINLDQKTFSRSTLNGQVMNFTADLDNHAKIYAYNLTSDIIGINAHAYAKAEIYPQITLKAIANDNSHIYYKGLPEEIMSEEKDYGKIIESGILELEDLDDSQIKFEFQPEFIWLPDEQSFQIMLEGEMIEDEDLDNFTIYFTK